jgi:hypothetical protein
MNQVLICYRRSQISELFHISKTSVNLSLCHDFALQVSNLTKENPVCSTGSPDMAILVGSFVCLLKTNSSSLLLT